ncbi:MAG: polymer-forming cytoskeletal protein [Rhodospirillales bacterium]|nr:MAG: polymer-forming cytoskeletal protein [Rhodospirillales bacterium]
MFGRKKDSDGVPAAGGNGQPEHDDLDIPAPKSPAMRTLTASQRSAPGSGSGFDAPRRPAASATLASSAQSAARSRSDAPSAPAASAAPEIQAATDSSKKLVVGREIRLKGEVTSCDILVVEGSVELSLTDARQIQVAGSGLFVGKVEVDEADIAGRFDGELTVRDRLIVRSGGRVTGRVRYGSIVVEAGGQIAGEVGSLAAEDTRGDTKAGGEGEPSWNESDTGAAPGAYDFARAEPQRGGNSAEAPAS